MSSSNRTPNLKGGCRLGRLAMFTIFPSNGERSIPQFFFTIVVITLENLSKFSNTFSPVLENFSDFQCLSKWFFSSQVAAPPPAPKKEIRSVWTLLNQIIAHYLLATKIVNIFFTSQEGWRGWAHNFPGLVEADGGWGGHNTGGETINNIGGIVFMEVTISK